MISDSNLNPQEEMKSAGNNKYVTYILKFLE